MFNNKQKEILNRSNLKLKELTEERVFEIAENPSNSDVLNTSELVEFLEVANALYRSGDRIISDADYDFIFLEELKRREPDHPFLQAVEPEAAFAGKTVELPVRMLSTDKTYDNAGINNWINRINKAAADIGK